MQNKAYQWGVMILLILVAVIGRWIPHPLNFTPVIAISLFAGFRLNSSKLAMFVPLLAMVISDSLLGFHELVTFTYPILVLTGLAAYLGRGYYSTTGVLGFSVLGAVAFFAVSNFGVWLLTGIYPKSLTGLFECYLSAVPFFQNTLASTLIFGFGLFVIDKTLTPVFESSPFESRAS